jgi:predicted transposase/invertase (TIGR01784 family)
MASRYLDPTNDVAFKKLFSKKDLLKDFLNAVLRLEEGCKITELEFISQEEVPNFKTGRRSIFDIKCKDQEGKNYIVEMQNRPEDSFLNRIQCYASHALVSQALKGVTHKGLVPVILLVITKENLFDDEIECISYHRTLESQTKKQLLFALSYVFIELPKFTKSATELKNEEDDWLFFFSNWKDSKEPPETITDPLVLEAYETIEQFNWTAEEYDAYFRARLAAEADDLMLTKNFEEGLEKGIEKGREEGLAEGRKEKEVAVEKAKHERNLEIAKTLLLQGVDIKTIAKATALSKEEIEKLRP